jgi:biopolymer transport protein ExbD
MNIPEDLDQPAEINIVPMIDVIFAILTFFIVATLFLTRSESLPVSLPEAETSETQQQTQIVITIEESGAIALNRNPVELSQLATEVMVLKGATAEAMITINADERVYHGLVVSVMDELRTLEGIRLGIATQRP